MAIQLDLIEFIKDSQKPLSPADGVAGPAPDVRADHGFETDVSRAVHSALIMRPIYDLDARRHYLLIYFFLTWHLYFCSDFEKKQLFFTGS